MKRNLAFRAWYYFRMGWSTYFAFIFAAINTLTVTYFLAIDNYPFLQEIFPTFEKAYKREGSSLVVEWGDYYNEK